MCYTCNCEAVREELALTTSYGLSESHSQPSIAEGVSGSAPTSPAAGSSKSVRRSTHHQTLSLGSKEMLDQMLVIGGPTGSAAGSNAASINSVGGGPGAAAGAGANGVPGPGPMQTRRDSSSGPYSHVPHVLHAPHVHEWVSRETSPDLLKLEAEAQEATRHTSVCVDALCSNLLQPSTMARATLRKLNPRKKRRSTIPARTVGTINMWTILKSNIGKTIDFYRMPIPVRCNPPSTRTLDARLEWPSN